MHFDEAMVQWHFAVWEWLLRNFGGAEHIAQRSLVLPEKTFFPDALTNDHAGVASVFEHVKKYIGVAEWPCHLEPLDEMRSDQDWSQRFAISGQWSSNTPAGTFQWTEEGVAIRYSTRDTKDIVALVATLSHELCHYLLATVKSDPPGGWDDHEFHTDIACAFTGFGVFQCNAALTFKQWGDHRGSGWSYSRKGYLGESEHAYGLAMFCALTGTPPSHVVRYLKGNAPANFTLALQDLSRREMELDALRSIAGGEAAAGIPPVFPDAPRGGAKPVKEGAPSLTLEEVKSLTFRDPGKEPLWQFYTSLIEGQNGEEWSVKEFTALSQLPPRLRQVVLAVRFDMLHREQGLQGAVLMDSADIIPDSERMLGMTAAAFESIGETRRGRLLASMIPGIKEHIDHLDEAERENRLDEFVSPLDRDEEWLEIGPSFVPELRQLVRDHAEELVFPPRK
jgi:hypothetical protein